MFKEIERKFLVGSVLDEMDKYPCSFILQGYLNDRSSDVEVRLRKKDDQYFLTVKKGKGKVRSEIEKEISKAEFYSLWPLVKKKVEKKRYFVPYMDNTLEIDVFIGNLKGLVLVEVEFKSETDSLSFLKPDWFGEEVTDNYMFKNNYLAN